MTLVNGQTIDATEMATEHNSDWTHKSAALISAGISTYMPTGAMLAYGAAVAPSGWLLCNGAAVSRTTYAALFAVIGETFGVGDTTTTFNVPDLQGRFPVGLGTHSDVNALADNEGEATVGNRTPAHTHTGPSHTHNQNSAAGGSDRSTGGMGIIAPSNSGGAMRTDPGPGTGAETYILPKTGVVAGGTGASGSTKVPFLTVNFIIKT